VNGETIASGGTSSSPSLRRSRSRGAGYAQRGKRLWFWLTGGVVATGRCLMLAALAVAGIGPLLALALIALLPIDVIEATTGVRYTGPLLASHGALALLLIAGGLLGFRLLTRVTRWLIGIWSGVPIASPYRQIPDGAGLNLGQQLGARAKWVVVDPSTWRDLLWLVVNACAGFVMLAAPVALVAYGLASVCLHGLTLAQDAMLGHVLLKGAGAIPAGFALMAAGLWLAPRLLTVYGGLARNMLAPTRAAELTSQVTHLARTRSDTIDAGAAELRGIERDLHAGAQARLVAMGMALDAAAHLLDDDPAAARSLLREARDSSAVALAELRDLVRGIHPPVLADRGLAEAIRALALDMPLPVNYTSDLTGRPPAPVESAAYFAVCELLANVSKHADAGRAWIDLRHDAGMLRIGVGDDGSGGAAPARGTGLRGIERRLAAFDGVLALSSPMGGPTVVNLEIPCALSSPKTSSC
jgi:signal transduction histidine kinase